MERTRGTREEEGNGEEKRGSWLLKGRVASRGRRGMEEEMGDWGRRWRRMKSEEKKVTKR